MMEYPKYTKVLFCTDFCKDSDSAFEFASDIAKKDRGLIYILHVIPGNPHQAFAEKYIAAEDLEEIEKGIEEDLETRFKEHYVKKMENGMKFRIVTKSGREAEEIVRFAKEEEVDLIVMATHGRKGIEHVFFGSVAEKVIRRSPFPVLVIPSKKILERS